MSLLAQVAQGFNDALGRRRLARKGLEASATVAGLVREGKP
jgi:hypothetical protein